MSNSINYKCIYNVHKCTYRVLIMTECNFVCSLGVGNLQVYWACMLSIHSPDDIFMALVSIFISKTHNHF